MSAEVKVALTLRLSMEEHERLRRTAFNLRRPISDLIREAIAEHHWHAEGIWCDDCPSTRRGRSWLDSVDQTGAGK